jgi:hypothetical protein
MRVDEEEMQECMNLLRSSALFRWMPDDALMAVIEKLEVKQYKQVRACGPYLNEAQGLPREMSS